MWSLRQWYFGISIQDKSQAQKSYASTYTPIPEYAPVTTKTLFVQSSPNFAASFAERNNPHKNEVQLRRGELFTIGCDGGALSVAIFGKDGFLFFVMKQTWIKTALEQYDIPTGTHSYKTCDVRHLRRQNANAAVADKN
jgi:hypothetical protein